jgi:4-aminobutyrate aminotransferase-like enzyme/Ser/Thr protein kinase RdoA (MazF antagonist)
LPDEPESMCGSKLFASLTTAPPGLSTAEAEEIAHREFGIRGEAHPLSSERDQNFRLRTSDGEQFALHIANPADSPAVIDLQARALLHILAAAPVLPVPRVIRTREGGLQAAIASRDGLPRAVWVISYCTGVGLNTVVVTSQVRRLLGTALGTLDAALRSFFHPAAGRELAWDLQQAPRLRELLPHMESAARRGLAEQFLTRFERDVASQSKYLRAQIIHNDFNPSNLLVDRQQPDRLAGILDFGDVVHAPLINDVAIAAAYHVSDDTDPLAGAAELVAQYHAANPLERGELELLFDLIGARLAMTVIITEWRAREYPQNADFILKHNLNSWRALERLRRVPRQDGVERFRASCFPVRRQALRVPQATAESEDQLQAQRARLFGPAYRLFYDEPLHIVRGEGVWLYDAAGRAYLDAYNNVPHVGHCHPRVVAALAAQASVLNTHTRYLSETVLKYAESLTEQFPLPLRAMMFTCTGSEANELALRIARAATGNRGIIATQHAYHGNTITISEFSGAYATAESRGPHIRTVPAPDSFRRPRDVPKESLGQVYAESVREAIESLKQQGIGLAAFIVDTVFSSDGILTVPRDYLQRVAGYVRAAGGVFIADEVQAGFGRTGVNFWGFEHFGVVPDIVTLGKPMGNGHPMAAVVTSTELTQAFGKHARYFNTFAGNPVSCAVGLAVLAVLRDERLQDNAERVGGYLRAGLSELSKRHELIGDVRGRGLFVGVELVSDRSSLEAATTEAHQIMNVLRDRGVLIATTGSRNNVLKIRPPMVFSMANADQLIETVDDALAKL